MSWFLHFLLGMLLTNYWNNQPLSVPSEFRPSDLQLVVLFCRHVKRWAFGTRGKVWAARATSITCCTCAAIGSTMTNGLTTARRAGPTRTSCRTSSSLKTSVTASSSAQASHYASSSFTRSYVCVYSFSSESLFLCGFRSDHADTVYGLL